MILKKWLCLPCLSLVVLASGPGCASQSQIDEVDRGVFSPVSDRFGQIEEAPAPRIIRQRLVSVRFPLLSRAVSVDSNVAQGSLLLNLFDDAAFKAVLNRREVRSEKSFTWFGHVPGMDNSQVTLVVENDVLVGNIRVKNAYYQVRYVKKGVHAVYQIDPRTFPPDSEPVLVPGRQK